MKLPPILPLGYLRQKKPYLTYQTWCVQTLIFNDIVSMKLPPVRYNP